MNDNLHWLIMQLLKEIYVLDYSVIDFILCAGKQPTKNVLMEITGSSITDVFPGSITDNFTPYTLRNLAYVH